MDQAWDGARGSRPSTASVQVRELSSQGLHNPQPQAQNSKATTVGGRAESGPQAPLTCRAGDKQPQPRLRVKVSPWLKGSPLFRPEGRDGP